MKQGSLNSIIDLEKGWRIAIRKFFFDFKNKISFNSLLYRVFPENLYLWDIKWIVYTKRVYTLK